MIKPTEQAAEEQYVPYGPEWRKEMSKFSKTQLIQFLSQVSSELTEANSKIAALEALVPKWKDIAKGELPEENQWCICAKIIQGSYDVMLPAHQFNASFAGSTNCFTAYGEPFPYGDITHWMPLPSPPEALTPNQQ